MSLPSYVHILIYRSLRAREGKSRDGPFSFVVSLVCGELISMQQSIVCLVLLKMFTLFTWCTAGLYTSRPSEGRPLTIYLWLPSHRLPLCLSKSARTCSLTNINVFHRKEYVIGSLFLSRVVRYCM